MRGGVKTGGHTKGFGQAGFRKPVLKKWAARAAKSGFRSEKL